ncbi:MAG: redoxin domain-containing protein [Candidatus Dormibacteraceae bacterium]
MFKTKRSLARYYAALGLLAIPIVAVAVVAHVLQQGPSLGTVVILASAKSADHLPSFTVSVHSGAGWTSLGKTAAGSVPAAPDQATLLDASLAGGTYDALKLGSLTLPGKVVIAQSQTTPVLVPISQGSVAGNMFYAGTDGVNLALAELSGQLKAVPAFSLTDQYGRPFSNAQIAGHGVVLAAFHTNCHVTCPLYTGLFLELRKQLPASVLLIEATTDPWTDTPAVLSAYAQTVGANWIFLTGTPAQMERFWAPFTVQLSGAQLHSSTLAVIDAHGFIRTYYQGIPSAVGEGMSFALLQELNGQGLQELASGGDGWGAPQIEDALRVIDTLNNPSQAGGGMATPFSLPALSGGNVGLASFRGRPVIANFWATYCTPCRSEMPMIARETGKHPDVQVIFIDERDSKAAAANFVRQLGLKDTVLLDQGGGVGDQYGVSALPTTVFITRVGSIEGRYIGQLSIDVLSEHISDLESL